MTVLDSLAKQANRLASDVQTSLKRARVEGERRLLQRQHRAALEELGERTYELVKVGRDAPGAGRRTRSGRSSRSSWRSRPRSPRSRPCATRRSAAADDPSRDAFPMVGDAPAEPTPGPGWEAADRFFKHDS